MKKALTLLLAALIVLSLAACGGTAPAAEKEQLAAEVEQAEPEAAEEAQEAPAEEAPQEEAPAEEPVEEETAEVSDTASYNGYTVKIVAVHKTVDSNGDPLAAVELEFTNDNADPITCMGAVQTKMFQNGVQMLADELFLERDFDWDSYYTEIKDGATIPVFIPLPLKSDDPVEVEVSIMDFDTWEVASSAQLETELVD